MTPRRRDFLRAGASVLAGTALGCSRSGPDEAPALPNVLIIFTDEHSAWTLGAYGGNLIGTPNLDRVGREGVIFNNFFTNSAVCTPSRGCFITGRYPEAHGAYKNNVEVNRDERTLAHMFRQAGYETAMLGKWHLDGEPRPGWMKPERAMGFDDCQWMYNRGHWKRIIERPEGWPNNRGVAKIGKNRIIPDAADGRPDIDYDVNAEGRYFTDWITGKTIDFIRRGRDRPFFCYLSIPDPHGPDTVGPPYDTMYKPEDMPIPATFYQENLPDWAEKARLAQLKADKAKSTRDPRREQILRQHLSQYCGMVKCIDDNVGRILEELEQQGMLDHTLIVFSSDHGDYMGEHGLYNKNQLYETAHRVSFLARLPGTIRPGTVVEECVATVDVQPTILSLLGLETSGREQGHDASPLMRGETTDWKNEAWIHHSSLQRAGVFTPQWEFARVKGGDTILFERRNDPNQFHNLAADPHFKGVVDELNQRVIRHNREVESPALEWLESARQT